MRKNTAGCSPSSQVCLDVRGEAGTVCGPGRGTVYKELSPAEWWSRRKIPFFPALSSKAARRASILVEVPMAAIRRRPCGSLAPGFARRRCVRRRLVGDGVEIECDGGGRSI